jgi:hypothetical protein
MSNFAATGLILGLFVANAFLIVVLARWVNSVADTIVTGVVRGVRVPISHRRRILQVNFLTNASGYFAAAAAITIAWIVMGRSAAHEEVRWVAYLFAFPNAVGAAGWFVALPLYYRHLAAVLRQAEAD